MSESKCRWCKKEFSHDIGIADDPPLWMYYYCSELCRLTDVVAINGKLLIKIRFLIDSDNLTKEKMNEIINSYEKEINLNE